MDKHFERDATEIVAKLGSSINEFSDSIVVLTGACGFLGSQFCHFFAYLNQKKVLPKPVKLIAIDNFIRGTPDWILNLTNAAGIEVLNADIVQHTNYSVADYVIHAASIASPIFYRKHPIETMDANVIGLRNLLDWAKDSKPRSLLFFSTSEIYGDPHPTQIPTSENYRGNVSCTGPRACYDESKRFGETLCVNFWQQHSVPVKIARPFNNYGPGLKISDRRVLPDFFRNVLADQNIIMLSDGTATRTFCYITDAITGYLQLLLSDENGEPFNIGIEKPEISMRNLADLVIKTSSKDLKVVFALSEDQHYETDNPQRRCPLIAKARSRIGFNPTIGLAEGLKRTWEYYRDHPNSENL